MTRLESRIETGADANSPETETVVEPEQDEEHRRLLEAGNHEEDVEAERFERRVSSGPNSE